MEEYQYQQPQEPHDKNKKSLCRFYLRGACIYSAKKCQFSHGIWDLNYDYYTEGEEIIYEFSKGTDPMQPKTIKAPIVYKDLYEFQTQKIYSLDDLAKSRPFRSEVRNLMHQKLFTDFMELLQLKHPDTIFSQDFLVRQFTRVGLNKIMGSIKISHISSYLCDVPNPAYYKFNESIFPDNKQVQIIARRSAPEAIMEFYKAEYGKILQKLEKPFEESVIKKEFFLITFPRGIPPLNVFLKEKKMNFLSFLQTLSGGQAGQKLIKNDDPIEKMADTVRSYLLQSSKQSLISWNDVYNHVTKSLKINNGNILNPMKSQLVLEGYQFLYFPMVQFIYHRNSSLLFTQLKKNPCQCKFQQKFQNVELMVENMNWKSQLKLGQSVDIDNFESLMSYAPHILKSKILGVDLEGRLRKGGFVEMIQLNNGRNTFLLDIWHLNQMGDFETFWLARKILRNVMVDPNIVKIFHDCRHDSLGLHEMIETCIINVFDTSASETLIRQLERYKNLPDITEKNALNKAKSVIADCNNVKTPGLNEIFEKYQASHGLNKNKDKYHKMWSKGEVSFFCKRPIDPDYRQYCIKDVLDLPQVYEKMLKQLPEEAIDLAFWIGSQYVQNGYINTQEAVTKDK